MRDVSSPRAAEVLPLAPSAPAAPPATGRRKKRATAPAACCEGCFFRNNMLCALERDEPCATFRPNAGEGLRPPRQLRFQFRTDARHTSPWAFPSADDQAAQYA